MEFRPVAAETRPANLARSKSGRTALGELSSNVVQAAGPGHNNPGKNVSNFVKNPSKKNRLGANFGNSTKQFHVFKDAPSSSASVVNLSTLGNASTASNVVPSFNRSNSVSINAQQQSQPLSSAASCPFNIHCDQQQQQSPLQLQQAERRLLRDAENIPPTIPLRKASAQQNLSSSTNSFWPQPNEKLPFQIYREEDDFNVDPFSFAANGNNDDAMDDMSAVPSPYNRRLAPSMGRKPLSDLPLAPSSSFTALAPPPVVSVGEDLATVVRVDGPVRSAAVQDENSQMNTSATSSCDVVIESVVSLPGKSNNKSSVNDVVEVDVSSAGLSAHDGSMMDVSNIIQDCDRTEDDVDDEDAVNVDDEEVMVVAAEDEEEPAKKELPPEVIAEQNACLNMVEYREEILDYLRKLQIKHQPKWNYMTKQPDITFGMRSILVDWLVEVGEEYKLKSETLHLAVNYIDRFLSVMSVQRAKLQLVGAACMFIAAKYEEIYPPDVGEFVYITDDTYSKKQVLRMEQLVLKVLNFDLSVCTQLQFVGQFSDLAGSDEEASNLATYLSELTLLDAETFLPQNADVVAAACVALSRHTLGVAAWPEPAGEAAGLRVDDFKDCLVQLHAAFTGAPELAQQAIREKFKQDKFLNVADLVPTPIF